jgi:hypothetical protein
MYYTVKLLMFCACCPISFKVMEQSRMPSVRRVEYIVKITYTCNIYLENVEKQ